MEDYEHDVVKDESKLVSKHDTIDAKDATTELIRRTREFLNKIEAELKESGKDYVETKYGMLCIMMKLENDGVTTDCCGRLENVFMPAVFRAFEEMTGDCVKLSKEADKHEFDGIIDANDWIGGTD